MEVILLQKVANLGNIGDRVKVKSGFGRNFLLPQGKATVATAENVRKFEERRTELEKAAREHLASAEERAAAMKDFHLRITAKAGAEGKLFGSVGTADIAEACTREGFKVSRSEVRLPNGALRMVGEHVITLHLHADIDVSVPVTIVAEE
jgi:large subunit ribosomal protein L9